MSTTRGPGTDEQYARVRVTGHYDRAHQLLVRNRPFEGANGYYVLVPLVPADGPALLVDRGWVSAGESATDVPRVPAGTDGRGDRGRAGSVPASRRPRPARRRGAR